MRRHAYVVLCLSSLLVSWGAATPTGAAAQSSRTLTVGDDFFAGPGLTSGARVSGKFHSLELLAAHFTLTRQLAPPARAVLADILFEVEFDGLGFVATWVVAGPTEVVESYLAALREDVANRTTLYDLGIAPLEVVYCCGGH